MNRFVLPRVPRVGRCIIVRCLATLACLLGIAAFVDAATPCKGNCNVVIGKGDGGANVYTIKVDQEPHQTDKKNLNWKIDNQSPDAVLVRFEQFVTHACGGGAPTVGCPGDLIPKGPECTSTVGPIAPGKQDHIELKNGQPPDACYKFTIVATNAANPGLHASLDPELQIDKGRSLPPIYFYPIAVLVLIALAIWRIRRTPSPSRAS